MTSERHDDEAPALAAWLAAAREDLAAREPPVWLEHQLRERLAERSALNAVRRTREAPGQPVESTLPQVRGRRRFAALSTTWPNARRLWPALATVAAACLALVIGVAVLAPLPEVPGTAGQAQADRSPFIALASLDAIAAESGTTVVPARLPRSWLADFGLPVDPARADVPLNAEFLMSPRGVVLAVRFVE
jgi:hypothetical protein